MQYKTKIQRKSYKDTKLYIQYSVEKLACISLTTIKKISITIPRE